MGYISGFIEVASGFVDNRLIAGNVSELPRFNKPNAGSGMMMISDMSSGLDGCFDSSELVFTVKLSQIARSCLFGFNF
ncbi:MAG: hypothetical protein A3F74_27830 [Betaproteobacteria bacterium RIFCSPLOWO2_12_FULL_62_58]|nr:MAG: hypothetical protein A3F74_27830 [Betaproteobacteria bacterium RIFCSPLOWO2_12_FULL_62_58]